MANTKEQSKSFNPWSLIYDDFDWKKEKSRESLLAVGNGYLGMRGAMEESSAGDSHYPGMYLAGLYNRLVSDVSGHDIENEDLVNVGNILSLTFRIDGGDWFVPDESNILEIYRELDFQTGVLVRELLVKDEQGRQTKVISQRLASMDDPHLVSLKYTVEPQNYEGEVEIKSELLGNHINDGVERYRSLDQKHLKPVGQGQNDDLIWLQVKTVQSNTDIVFAARHTCLVNENEIDTLSVLEEEESVVRQIFSVAMGQGISFSVEKTISIYTSKADDTDDPKTDSIMALQLKASFAEMVASNALRWKDIWDSIDIKIEGDPKSQMLVRMHLYHLMVTASPHNVRVDAGIPARGLHGEAYRGHIFWDELYILPIYNLFMPEVAKSILRYRYRRLDKARAYAKEYGFQGAMFPWQSGSDGREETQILHLNPLSGEWGDDYSSLQRHISIAIAYNVWNYFQVSNDLVFMETEGAELFLEICRFWASKCELNPASGKYEIKKVMGPDEFHEEHPNSPGGGVKDNAYTNLMVAWLFKQAKGIFDKLGDSANEELSENLNIDVEELERWHKIAEKLNLEISDQGILSQFDGYFGLDELDWDGYRKKYSNIYRLDRILKAEGKSPDDYKLAKQADTLMTFYNLDQKMIAELMQEMGYTPSANLLKDNYHYYINRTSHGSTLSRVVHAYLANQMGDPKLAWELYSEALESDYTDIQGGTTAEGIHAGVMGGTVLMLITSFAGINLMKDSLEINPSLPDNWDLLSFGFNFRGGDYKFVFSKSQLELSYSSQENAEAEIVFLNKTIVLHADETVVLKY